MANSPVAVAPKSPVAVPAAPAGKKAATYAETALITVLVPNPKKAASAKRFALYGAVGGKPITVKEYLDGCVLLHPEDPRGRWRADLAWDVARKYVTIA